jgi:hypothetical protein
LLTAAKIGNNLASESFLCGQIITTGGQGLFSQLSVPPAAILDLGLHVRVEALGGLEDHRECSEAGSDGHGGKEDRCERHQPHGRTLLVLLLRCVFAHLRVLA